MTIKNRQYKELVKLLEETGVLQFGEDWSQEIVDLIRQHKIESKNKLSHGQ